MFVVRNVMPPASHGLRGFPNLVRENDGGSSGRPTSARPLLDTVGTMKGPLNWWRSARTATDVHPFATDVAFAALLGVFAVSGLLTAVETGSQRSADWFGVVLVLGQTTAFAFRRRQVWWSLLGVVTFTIAFWIADYATNFDAFTLLAVYAATVHGGDDRRLVWRRVGLAVGVLTLAVVLGVISPDEDLPGIALFGIVTIHLTAAFVGEAVYDRRRRIIELQQRAERAEAERELLARQAVLDERSRIAREMHDIVAHGMSVMVVQAGAAERAVATDPEAARAALATIGDVGRDSLAEMRRLLGVLRGGEQPGLQPQPTLDDVEQLVRQCNSGGTSVSLRIDGEAPVTSASRDVAAYRVVQEALTNVLKHAGPDTTASVRITHRPDATEIEIDDDGRGTSFTELERATGQGIVGMRERVELFGGTLTAAPRSGGGFRVRALLPSTSPSTSPSAPPASTASPAPTSAGVDAAAGGRR